MLSVRLLCALAFIWFGSVQCAAGAEGIDLGVVSYPVAPDARSMAGISVHRWTAPTVNPELHRLGYVLADSERRVIEARLAKFIISTGYSEVLPGSLQRFSIREMPKRCVQNNGVEKDDLFWSCVFGYFAEISEASIWPLALRLIERIRRGHLSGQQGVLVLLSFVQEIPYKLQYTRSFGLLPPSMVAYDREGDCDSKALLAHMLFTAARIPTVLLLSKAHHHAILGVAIAVPGQSRDFRGTRYALAETTAKLPIGYIDPKLFRPDDWRVISVYDVRKMTADKKR